MPSLKEIQIWILNNILQQIKISKYAKAYVIGKNTIDNAKYHTAKDEVLNLDIKDFFPSIKRDSVENIFLKNGYSSNISNLLSKLCCLNENLPQGAPTSPYISNIFLNDFDTTISEYCNKNKIRYTRYADDLTFSGNFNINELITLIIGELKTLNLQLNQQKTKVQKQNQRQIVTGIVVNKSLSTPKNYRNKIRLEMYYLQKYGLSEHLKYTRNSRANYIKHLIGKINYSLFVNKEDNELKKYRDYLKQNYSDASDEG